MRSTASLVVVLGFAAFSAQACDSTVDGTGSGGGGTTAQSGMPCEVEAVLETCTACHAGATPSGGLTLVTRDDLLAASMVDPNVTVAERALARMKDPEFPMPPTGALPADQIATFEAWVQDGDVGGDCETVAGGPPATVCTSNKTWTQGNHGSILMHPGLACITCHEKPGGRGPSLLFGGTVYPSLHEPDDCYGGGTTITGAEVVVTDANGVEHTAKVRANGNFLIESIAQLKTPARAEVRLNGKVAKMKEDVTTGDCNACHTEQGASGAPGRIQAP